MENKYIQTDELQKLIVRSEPEKPENSAHGYTEGSNMNYRPGFPNCTGRCQLTSGCNCPHGVQGVATDSTPIIVEPSESQEEDQIDLLSEILVDYKTWLDDPETGMRDYENFQARQLSKFTITRK